MAILRRSGHNVQMGVAVSFWFIDAWQMEIATFLGEMVTHIGKLHPLPLNIVIFCFRMLQGAPHCSRDASMDSRMPLGLYRMPLGLYKMPLGLYRMPLGLCGMPLGLRIFLDPDFFGSVFFL